MDLFKLFNIRISLKRKYRIILACALIFILVFHLLTIFGFCSSDDFTSVSLDTVENLSVVDSRFVESSVDNTVYYFQVKKGVTYNIQSPVDDVSLFICKSSVEPALGVGCSTVVYVTEDLYSYTFTAEEDGYYISTYRYGWEDLPPVVTSNEYNTSMPVVLGSLIDFVNQDTLGQVFIDSLPYISLVVLVSVGIYLISKMIFGLNKGKAKV